jgi:hypothetical protein
MANPQPKKRRRIWRTLLVTVLGLGVFLLLFVTAFVFNPLEGRLPELRDVVPRGVNFFVRKQGLRDDFDPFPLPAFWSRLSEARGFTDVANGGLGQDFRQAGLDRAVADAAAAVEKLKIDSGGFVDVLRDLIGEEVIFAGYEQDYTQTPARPLAAPWWCLYTRVSWRIKAAHGLLGFGFVQGKLAEQGVTVADEGELLVVTPAGSREPLYVKRHLDVLMIANHKLLLEQGQRLLDGNRDEEPIGQMPAYTDGAVKRIEQWASDHGIAQPNVLEFVVEPNAFDGFRRFAAGWPNPQNRDSMNERVLASFLNLKGWMQVTGGVMFAEDVLGITGQVGLNSNQHTPFQSSFYSAEQRRREEWLDPFLRMVPDNACAAAALRMPAGEFLHAMFEALEPDEKNLVNDGIRRASFLGTPLNDTRDLIERVRVAFLPRTGFVFRRNTPDLSRDENGDLMVPVAAKSPMPQVAWVFWLGTNGDVLANELVNMLRTYYSSFGFRKVWHLKVPFEGGSLPEPVTEFTNPQIPATGELAMIVFRDFFVLSNSGPLIRDILRTRYGAQTRARSVRERPEFESVERELRPSLNGLVWLSGRHLVEVFDDYLSFADSGSATPDPEWMMLSRPAAEDHVRRTRFPQYPSKASMPRPLVDGEFEQAVVAHLREQWTKERTNFTAKDKADFQQLRGIAQMFKAAAVQLELQTNYIRLQARVMGDWR